MAYPPSDPAFSPLRHLFPLAALAIAPACIGKNREVQPLYDTSVPMDEKSLATLEGNIERVDGKRVGEGGLVFRLEAGCHVVQTPTRWGDSSVNASVVATLPAYHFPIPMKPSHRYTVKLDAVMWSNSGRVHIHVYESDNTGKRTKEFAPYSKAHAFSYCGLQLPSE